MGLSDIILVEIQTRFRSELSSKLRLVLYISLMRNRVSRMVVEVPAHWVVWAWGESFILLRSKPQTSSVSREILSWHIVVYSGWGSGECILVNWLFLILCKGIVCVLIGLVSVSQILSSFVRLGWEGSSFLESRVHGSDRSL